MSIRRVDGDGHGVLTSHGAREVADGSALLRTARRTGLSERREGQPGGVRGTYTSEGGRRSAQSTRLRKAASPASASSAVSAAAADPLGPCPPPEPDEGAPAPVAPFAVSDSETNTGAGSRVREAAMVVCGALCGGTASTPARWAVGDGTLAAAAAEPAGTPVDAPRS